IAVLCSLSIGVMSEDARILAPSLALLAGVFLTASLVLGGKALSPWLGASSGRARHGPLRVLGMLLIAVACLVPAAGIALGAATMVAPAALLPALLAITATVVFWFLLKAPTRLGRKTLDAIEGYRLFLSVAEAGRLNAAG